MDAMVAYTLDTLEAKARKLMAEQHIARGWDGQRERTEWLHKVDNALDAWLLLNRLESVDAEA